MTYRRCNNCLLSHSGDHPYICTVCHKTLQDRGVACKIKLAPPRTAWWLK